MLYNIMKRASLPKLVNESVKNLDPISDEDASNLHEELSFYFKRQVLKLYVGDSLEHLAVDLYRLKNGNIDSLSEDLWGRWRKVSLKVNKVQQEIRGMKTEIREEVSEFDEDGKRKDKHKRRMKGPKVINVEYSGSEFSQKELFEYFGRNYAELSNAFGDISFSRFVDGVLPALAMSPLMVSKDSENNSLGFRTPKVLLDHIELILEYELYDVANSDFVSKPSERQVQREIGSYMRSLRDAVFVSTDLEDAIEKEAKRINSQKIKQFLATPKKPQSSLVLAEVSELEGYYFDDDVFEGMIESIELEEIKAMIYPFVAEGLGFDEVDELDMGLLNTPEIQDSMMLEIKTLARKKFNDVKEEVTEDLRRRLLDQKKLVEKAFNSSDPISQVLDLLSSNKATWKDVRQTVWALLNYRGGGNRAVLASISSEVLSQINIQQYVNKQIMEKTEKKKVKKNGKEVEEDVVVGITFKKAGRNKLEKEVSKLFKNQSNAFTTTLIDLAFNFVAKKVKQDYLAQNNLDPSFA